MLFKVGGIYKAKAEAYGENTILVPGKLYRVSSICDREGWVRFTTLDGRHVNGWRGSELDRLFDTATKIRNLPIWW